MIEFESDLAGIAGDLDRLAASLVNQRTLNLVGLAGTRLIRERTRKGIDQEGRGFRPYSPAYAALKRAASIPDAPVSLEYGVTRTRGRRDGGLPADAAPVRANLYDSMLSHLTHVVSADLDGVAIRLDQERANRIATYHTGDGRVLRDFAGFTPEDEDALAELLGDEIAQLITDVNLS